MLRVADGQKRIFTARLLRVSIGEPMKTMNVRRKELARIMTYELSHLRELEAESIHIMREVAAEFENPALMFSGGKDSIVMLRLAEKAFSPAKIPFPVLHVDTGHNFPEVINFRDKRTSELGIRLIVGKVQDSIDKGTASEEKGPRASRNLSLIHI